MVCFLFPLGLLGYVLGFLFGLIFEAGAFCLFMAAEAKSHAEELVYKIGATALGDD
jgi:hypothetical protein